MLIFFSSGFLRSKYFTDEANDEVEDDGGLGEGACLTLLFLICMALRTLLGEGSLVYLLLLV
jgi:hypothetical protein